MRDLVTMIAAAAALALGCASAPVAKRPDESRRTPVNTAVPAELQQGRGGSEPAKKPAQVEWR